jgi:hypothetical protein
MRMTRRTRLSLLTTGCTATFIIGVIACNSRQHKQDSLKDYGDPYSDNAYPTELEDSTAGRAENIPHSYIHFEMCEKYVGEIPVIDCKKPDRQSNMKFMDLKGGPRNKKNEYGIEVCEKPSMIQTTECRNPARFIWTTGNDDVKWVAMCRSVESQQNKLSGIIPGIGLIGFNRKTGHTCFLNSPQSTNYSGSKSIINQKIAKMDAIDDVRKKDYLTRAGSYHEPESFGQKEGCTNCHQGKDPWIVDQFSKPGFVAAKIDRYFDTDPTGENTKYSIVGMHRHVGWFSQAPLIEMENGNPGQGCVSCHLLPAIGQTRALLIGFTINAIASPDALPASPHMPPINKTSTSEEKEAATAMRISMANCLNGLISRNAAADCIQKNGPTISWVPEEEKEKCAKVAKFTPNEFSVNSIQNGKAISVSWNINNSINGYQLQPFDTLGFEVELAKPKPTNEDGERIPFEVYRTASQLKSSQNKIVVEIMKPKNNSKITVRPYKQCQLSGQKIFLADPNNGLQINLK